MREQLVPCGPQERLFFALSQAGGSTSWIVTSLRVKGIFDAERLRRAVIAVQERHPKLRCRFAFDEKQRLCFAVAETPRSIPLEFIDCSIEDPAWHASQADLADRQYDALNDSLWQLRVVQDRSAGISEFILVAHHSVFDGMSTGVWYHEVLSIYAAGDAAEKSPPMPLRMSGLLTPPAPKGTGWRMARGIAAAAWKNLWRRKYLPKPPPVEPPPIWARLLVTGPALAALNDTLQREKVGFATWGAIAAAKALCETLDSPGLRVHCAIPVDVRRYLSPSVGMQDIGCFVSLFHHPVDVERDTPTVPLARWLRERLMQYLNDRGPAAQMAILDRFPIRWMPKKRRRQMLIAMSHIPAFPLERTYGDIEPLEIWTNVKIRIGAPSIHLMSIQLQSALCISVRPSGMSKEQAEACIRCLARELGIDSPRV